MIIAAWVTAWLLTATSPATVVVPLLALFARASFLERRVGVDGSVVVSAASVFVIVLVGGVETNAAFGTALLWSGRTFCFLVLAKHILISVASTDANPLKQFPFPIAEYAQYARRGTRILAEQFAEAARLRKMRQRRLGAGRRLIGVYPNR